tara:strand:- start:208 stop:390 length:183 start_codon:yes stop_codon:yes gene_type:complete
MRIKVGDLVQVEDMLALVTEVYKPLYDLDQYGLPPVYWIKFVEDGEELRVQHTDIVKVIR